jgi:CRP-like cAMP-binding protein
VAGSSKIVKPGEVLFKQGDPADSMYIVRRGNLKVYIMNGLEEIQLAALAEGAIVGEMAFFDQKPRSACVKATLASEVTVITKADFDKLVLQMPKWIMSMMQSLVGRLRQTNEKLMTMEQQLKNMGDAKSLLLPGELFPYQHVTCCLKLLNLSAAKDGQKEGSSVILETEVALKLWLEISSQGKEVFDAILNVCEEAKFIARKTNSMKLPVIQFTNKGQMSTFAEFCALNAKFFTPAQPYFTKDAQNFALAVCDAVGTSGYETLSVGLGSLSATYKGRGVDSSKWGACATELERFGFYKSSKNAGDFAMKVSAKEAKAFLSHMKVLSIFWSKKLY